MSKLQETSVATMTESDNFDELVELDIAGQADDSHLDVLMGDPERWRESLLDKLREVDCQFTEGKALLKVAASKQAKIDYELWKKSAVTRKAAIVGCLREAKAVVKEDNREKYGREQYHEIAAKELVAIRQLLEKLVNKVNCA